MDAFWAIILFCSVAGVAGVVVRSFNKALQQARSVPKGPTPGERQLDQVRQEVADLRGTLRGDVADFERRLARGEGD